MDVDIQVAVEVEDFTAGLTVDDRLDVGVVTGVSGDEVTGDILKISEVRHVQL